MTDVHDQVKSYLSDAHAIEEQALAQLRSAPAIAGDEKLAAALAEHLPETASHERWVRDRLDELGESPSRLKDMLMAAGGKGFVLFARAQPDTPGSWRPTPTHTSTSSSPPTSCWRASLPRLETKTPWSSAIRIAADEQRMGDRLEGLFDETVASRFKHLTPTISRSSSPSTSRMPTLWNSRRFNCWKARSRWPAPPHSSPSTPTTSRKAEATSISSRSDSTLSANHRQS